MHDFGYKRVYAADVAQLEQLQIWELQRVFSEKRAQRIAKDKATTAAQGLGGRRAVNSDVRPAQRSRLRRKGRREWGYRV